MMKSIVNRMMKPTPRFFKKVRNVGVILAAMSAAILALPITLPLWLASIAGYLAVTATMVSAVSQTAVKNEKI